MEHISIEFNSTYDEFIRYCEGVVKHPHAKESQEFSSIVCYIDLIKEGINS